MTNDKYKIIISISHRRISFEYWQMGSGEVKLLPMPGCEWPAPLAFYSSPTGIVVGEEAQRAAANGTKDAFGQYFEYLVTNETYSYGEQQKSIGKILLDAAETLFSRFFREVLLNKYGALTDNRATMPLTIVCEADIKPNERAYISYLFTDSGFNKTKVVDYDDYIANYCSEVLSKQYTCNKVLVAWTEGSDLDFTLFDVNDKNKRQHETLPNLGIDPRFEYVKNLIWSDFCEQNPFLMRDDSVESIINREATDYLNSSAPTVKAQITLPDGIKYQYYLDRNRINFLQSDNGIVIKQGLDKFLNSANVSKGETLLILRGIAANNAYFEQTLSHGFLKIVKSDGKLRGDIMKLLIKDSTPTPPDEPQLPVVGPPKPPAPPLPPEPTRDDKKKVRLATANIKGKIRIKDFDGARNQIQNLSDELHNMGLLPFFDAEIEELRKLIPAPHPPRDRTPKQPSLPPVSTSYNWKREEKTTMAEAKAKARCGNKEEAVNIAKTLLARLHADGERSFDEEITTFISEHTAPVQKPKPGTKPAQVSRATKLLQDGRFAEAKKEFAKEQNSEMAQVCTSLIKSTKTIEMYSSGLESVKRNKNKSAVALALKALTETRQLYDKHNIDTQKIDSLITEYKQLK